MFSTALREQLTHLFPKTNKEDWRKKASYEIDDDEPEKKLQWTSADGLIFSPYYDESDVSDINYLTQHTLRPRGATSKPRVWANLAPLKVDNVVTANTKARHALMAGADGVCFDLGNQPGIAFDELLRDVDWSVCVVSFLAPSPSSSIVTAIADFAAAQNKRASFTGSIFWPSLPDNPTAIIEKLSPMAQFRPLGLIVPAGTAATEIATALIRGTEAMDQLTRGGMDTGDALIKISWSLEVGPDFFESIAKFKALRLLLRTWAKAYGLDTSHGDAITIHAQVGPHTVTSFEPHSNMLHTTIAALAAVLGGVDSLCSHPEDSSQEMLTRIARNVSAILMEESHVDKVADPTAGAYWIDTMVDSLASRAWSIFLKKLQP